MTDLATYTLDKPASPHNPKLRRFKRISFGPNFKVKVKPVNLDTYSLLESSQGNCTQSFSIFKSDDYESVIHNTIKNLKVLNSVLSQNYCDDKNNIIKDYKNLITEFVNLSQSIQKNYRQTLLNITYSKNKKDKEIPSEMEAIRKEADEIICELPFEDCGVKYNPDDYAWDYILLFPQELRVRLTIFDDDGIDNVDYFINLKGKLLVADSMPLKEIKEKLLSILGDEPIVR